MLDQKTLKKREEQAWLTYNDALTAMLEMSQNLRLAIDAAVDARNEWQEAQRAIRAQLLNPTL